MESWDGRDLYLWYDREQAGAGCGRRGWKASIQLAIWSLMDTLVWFPRCQIDFTALWGSFKTQHFEIQRVFFWRYLWDLWRFSRQGSRACALCLLRSSNCQIICVSMGKKHKGFPLSDSFWFEKITQDRTASLCYCCTSSLLKSEKIAAGYMQINSARGGSSQLPACTRQKIIRHILPVSFLNQRMRWWRAHSKVKPLALNDLLYKA